MTPLDTAAPASGYTSSNPVAVPTTSPFTSTLNRYTDFFGCWPAGTVGVGKYPPLPSQDSILPFYLYFYWKSAEGWGIYYCMNGHLTLANNVSAVYIYLIISAYWIFWLHCLLWLREKFRYIHTTCVEIVEILEIEVVTRHLYCRTFFPNQNIKILKV